MHSTKREDILSSATKLFSQYGYNAVGVDSIIKDSNVAKMTFYRYFPSKDILVEQVLVRRNENLQAAIKHDVNNLTDPLLKLKMIFDWYESWIFSEDFHGCMFIRASEEFRDPTNFSRKIAQAHKDWFIHFIESILKELNLNNTEQIATHMVILLEGITVRSNMYASPSKDEFQFAWQCISKMVSENQSVAEV